MLWCQEDHIYRHAYMLLQNRFKLTDSEHLFWVTANIQEHMAYSCLYRINTDRLILVTNKGPELRMSTFGLRFLRPS